MITKDCGSILPEVTLSVVDIISASEIEKCAFIAKEIGANFNVRHIQNAFGLSYHI
jgi:hypothetical protein